MPEGYPTAQVTQKGNVIVYTLCNNMQETHTFRNEKYCIGQQYLNESRIPRMDDRQKYIRDQYCPNREVVRMMRVKTGIPR